MSDGPALIVPETGFKKLDSDLATAGAAAAILAASTGEGTLAAGHEQLKAAQIDAAASMYGLTIEGDLVAVYTLRQVHLAMEVTSLAVAPEHRRRGYGKRALADALRRAGRLPLVAETGDDALGFYKRCGFKPVGRRKLPNGVVRYRLGAHAPRPDQPPTR